MLCCSPEALDTQLCAEGHAAAAWVGDTEGLLGRAFHFPAQRTSCSSASSKQGFSSATRAAVVPVWHRYLDERGARAGYEPEQCLCSSFYQSHVLPPNLSAANYKPLTQNLLKS